LSGIFYEAFSILKIFGLHQVH